MPDRLRCSRAQPLERGIPRPVVAKVAASTTIANQAPNVCNADCSHARPSDALDLADTQFGVRMGCARVCEETEPIFGVA